jgi:GT2 family glycosyltransferase
LKHPPGTIIVPTNGFVRHVQFVADLFLLDKPSGTHIKFTVSSLVTQNLNNGLRDMVGEWAWFQADDHAIPRDLLIKLLDHEADVVVPLIVRSSAPDSYVFGNAIEVEDDRTGRKYPAYETIPDFPREPFTVEVAGSAGMLVRKHVLDAIGDPWFESTDGLYLNEDIIFSHRIRDAGFTITVDPNLRMGHILPLTVWPL